MSRKILITGGCGFIGSTLAILIRQKYPDYAVISFDNLKRRGSELNIERLKKAGVKFIHGDIRNKEDFDQVGEADAVIEASAEPSVLAGITSSAEYLVNTNLLGTVNCLNYAVKNNSDFIFLSTSRVYPYKTLDAIVYEEEARRFRIRNDNTTIQGLSAKGISESFAMEGPRSLYGATKLASELLITEYNEMYGLRTIVNRCGVVAGPYQMGKVDQGVVVLWMAAHVWNRELNYIGYGGQGKQVRDILHAHDLFDLVDFELHHIIELNGVTFNAGGGIENSVSLVELTALCEEVTGNKIKITGVLATRAADVRIFVTDNSKVTALTGWKPGRPVRVILEDIHTWIMGNKEILKNVLNQN